MINHIKPPLEGDNLVRLIYLDEAGKSNPKHEPFFVVAGVIIHGDAQWKAIEQDIWEVVCKHIAEEARDGLVFHATELFSGGRQFDRETWPREKRWAILDDLIGIVSKYPLPVVHGYVPRAKLQQNLEEQFPHDKWDARSLNQMAHGLAFAECAKRAQEWMGVYGGSELAMFIAEDVPDLKRYLKRIHALLRDPNNELFQVSDVPMEPLTKIIDTIHFAGKNETSILQLADVCAFVWKRALMGKDDAKRFFPPIWAATIRPEDRQKQFREMMEKGGISWEGQLS